MKKLIFLILIFFSACKWSADAKFEEENEQIKAEFQSQTTKFVKENASKLTEEQLNKGLNRIAEEHLIHRNKKLAAKYVNSKSGLKRLNFLKDKFSKKELIQLLKQVSPDLKTNPDYKEIKNYI